MASSTSSLPIRAWRTAFLTMRDENLTPLVRTSLPKLLQTLIFSQSEALIAAAPDLPVHEVTSDVLFLLELAENVSEDPEEMMSCCTQICHLIHGVGQRVSLELNSQSWSLMLGAFSKMVEVFLGKPQSKGDIRVSSASTRASVQCLETIRRLMNAHYGRYLFSEETKLIRFLLQIIDCSFTGLPYWSNGTPKNVVDPELNKPGNNNLWELKTHTFIMIGELFSKSEKSAIPYDIWKTTLESLRKVMDGFTHKTLLVEDSVMSRFYDSILNCLHLVLADPKGSLSDQVAGLVASLRLFLAYGLTNLTQPGHYGTVKKDWKGVPSNLTSRSGESTRIGTTAYRPPHLRKKDAIKTKESKLFKYQTTSDQESSSVDYSTSDSDCSDSDGSKRDIGSIHSSKVRVAAIMCIQDLCQADSRSFSAQWTLLLPTNDVFQSRNHEANLMTCLLFDPSLKAQLASASALSTMLDGPASVFLQVAEYKEAAKSASFTALSTSLGLILMQLHKGILYLIENETHGGLLASLFRILMHLIQSTPYARMPSDLLLTVTRSLGIRIEKRFKFDQTGLQVAAFGCLTAALSTSPPSMPLKGVLLEELSTGSQDILHTIFLNCERVTNPTMSFEALQALRAVAHNYPMTMDVCWDRVSTIIYAFLRPGSTEASSRLWKGRDGPSAGIHGEKFIAAAVKVLDECLRAVSGFKGTEDQLDDKLLDNPFGSDGLRTKKISSAPLYGLEKADNKIEQHSSESGSKQWRETLEKHLPFVLQHSSAMVRAASMTCFAGITSSVFFSLTKDKQDYIITSLIKAADTREATSVRCAACRAIGVISCFRQISQSAEILVKFTNVAESNSNDSLISVRIASSWALANICDSLLNYVDGCSSGRPCNELNEVSDLIVSVLECALRLTKDGDKVKANAVRALGNLSRLVYYGTPASPDMLDADSSVSLSLSCNRKGALMIDPCWLEKMVQAFLSCVSTGNVKVQWNVCYALSNLFLNKTLKLQDMDWAPSVFSILLILLRDSSNFKIRIQAAAALAVPVSMNDYGRSFIDIVQGLEHVIKTFASDQFSAPSSIKYRVALENQLLATMLHVLSVAYCVDNQDVKDFFLKKASFFEDWFKAHCTSLGQPSLDHQDETLILKQKREMISRAVCSLVQLYEGMARQATAQRFKSLLASIS